MAERRMYQATQSVEKKIARAQRQVEKFSQPSDEQFKAIWKKAHHGKLAGWGMGKANWIANRMKSAPEYLQGMWQGRVDALRGLDYSEERIEKAYNLGYYRGYCNWETDREGMNQEQLAEFETEYSL